MSSSPSPLVALLFWRGRDAVADRGELKMKSSGINNSIRRPLLHPALNPLAPCLVEWLFRNQSLKSRQKEAENITCKYHSANRKSGQPSWSGPWTSLESVSQSLMHCRVASSRHFLVRELTGHLVEFKLTGWASPLYYFKYFYYYFPLAEIFIIFRSILSIYAKGHRKGRRRRMRWMVLKEGTILALIQYHHRQITFTLLRGYKLIFELTLC